ncbi:MAG: sigma-70 family RNA polymerase sigma factor [Planctomycetales bacterium]|nr:sigma-70 family RNA polymerase sigma factor [Planctomycetales bacterium]
MGAGSGSDEDLVARARGGDREAFGSLVERYGAAVTRFLAIRGGRGAAEDLAQEAFVKAWTAIGTLRETDRFAGWLFRIASRVALDAGRAARRRQARGAEVYVDADALVERVPLAPAAGETGDSGAAALAEVARLPEREQHLLALRHGEGRTCAEIAEALGLPLGTVTKTLSRAYARLRERLAARHGIEGPGR